MKKLGIISLILLIALGSIGVVYANWSQTLTGTANVYTGSFKADITQAITDDTGTGSYQGHNDPSTAGTYSSGAWSGTNPVSQDVAYMTVSASASGGQAGNPVDTLTVTVYNAYPGYFGTVYFVVSNDGTIPMNISVPATGTKSLTISTSSSGAAATDIGATLSSNVTGSGTNLAAGASTGIYLYVGVATNGATTTPPVTGATYTITFTINAVQSTQ